LRAGTIGGVLEQKKMSFIFISDEKKPVKRYTNKCFVCFEFEQLLNVENKKLR
jgi:hypothetical protein